MVNTYNNDKLRISIFANRDQMGFAAARALYTKLKLLLDQQQTVRIIFAAAPSQLDLLKYIREFTNIDWLRVTAF
ncbi:MAG: glucosamine-6-phosphate deaminase, partial [Candidatus Marinimicrobia bacterium]|nr:glucosamine-6-phosphate deaminase [Candidatus Neomarinimicrobiota bacterium]